MNNNRATGLDWLKVQPFMKDEIDISLEKSIFYYIPTPKSIRYPKEYDGVEALSIVCTQTELTATQQKKLVQSWCETFPTLENVQYVHFHSRVNQELFDAVCRIKSLKGLYVKWSGLKSIDAITQAKQLKYLSIGSSPSITSLKPLQTLLELEWLEINNIHASADLHFLEKLPQLKGLEIAGDINSSKPLNIDTLRPLQALQQLYWLSLPMLNVKHDGLQPLAKLSNLKYLLASDRYTIEDIAMLYAKRLDINCWLFEPIHKHRGGIGCEKCKQDYLVSLTGKGKGWKCPTCDGDKIDKHKKSFYDLVKKYAVEKNV